MFFSWSYVAGVVFLQLVSTSLADVTVSTFAGSRRNGGINILPSTSPLAYPYGVAIDAFGSLYVTESQDKRIHKITPGGRVLTLAVRWDRNIVDFTRSIAVDGRGNIFITQHRTNKIHIINRDGYVSVYAGGDASGYVDGPARTARFNDLKGLVVDPNGNLIVVDSGNNCIRKITPDGMVSTLAGNGTIGLRYEPDSEAEFDSPSSIAVDPHGNVYVVDDGNACISKITPDGTVSKFSGIEEMGTRSRTGRLSIFRTPMGIAADANGNVYVTDRYYNRIRKITQDGTVTIIAGDGNRGCVNGPGLSARFNRLDGIVVDRDGNLLVADSWNHRIRKVTFTPGGNNGIIQSHRPVPPRPIRYNQDECAICYEVKADDDEFDYCSISCGNTFHRRCIDRCMTRSTQQRCPMCRSGWILDKPSVAIPTASDDDDEE